MTDAPLDLVHRLRLHGQEHVLAAWPTLSDDDRAALVAQLAGVDLGELEALFTQKQAVAAPITRDRVTPLPVQDGDIASPDAVSTGCAALLGGEVAVLVVAGGQGSRLGFDKPKGMYPVGPISDATLFRIHAEKVLALSKRFGTPVPFLVMTSPATHADTEEYFRCHHHFGLGRGQVTFFQQGTMPAIDAATGKLIMETPGRLFLSPNGHGGTLTALADTGLLSDLIQRGVKHLFYFQIDNPLVNVADPAFVGRHVLARAEVSSKVVFKERADEKVGVLALIDGRCGIIEYSDMPAAMTNERDATGELVFRAGNPAIHIFDTAFLQRITAGAGQLPYHVARKKVPYADPVTGKMIQPATENALKFERFIFDALPLADRPLAVSTRREDEFAPLKNATGADSPGTVRRAMIDRAGRWLAAAGVSVPTDAAGHIATPVEISPLYALDPAELAAKLPAGFALDGPTFLS